MFGFGAKRVEISQERRQELAEATRGLALYHFSSCPFCRRVSGFLESNGIEIEHRDIMLNAQHREELLKGGGMTQVPCLRIEDESGKVQWLYESADIMAYVSQRVA